MRIITKIFRAIRLAGTEFREGIKVGYPICCITNFCIDEVLGHQNERIKRHINNLPRGGYVPCVLCCIARHQSYQHRITQLFLDYNMLDKEDQHLLPDNIKALVVNPVKP